MNLSFLIFLILSFTTFIMLKSEIARPRYIWRRFGIEEDFRTLSTMLGKRKKEKVESGIVENLKDFFAQKQKEYDDEMEAKRRKILKIYLEPRAGPTSLLSDLYNRF